MSGNAPEDVSSIQLKPGQLIRPELSEGVARQLVEKLYGVKIKSISEANSYDDKNYLVQLEPEWTNPHIKTLWPHGYVFKVLNSMDSQKKHVEAEHQIEHILSEKGINCPLPELNVNGKEYSIETLYRDKSRIKGNNNGQSYSLHICRLMKYVPGKILHAVPYIPSLLFDVGAYTAMIQDNLKGFDHPALRNHKTIWSLASVPDLKDFAYVIENEEHKTLICDILDTFSREVIPLYGNFRQGVIHGDINEQNLVVSKKAAAEDTEYELSGILDFGDATYSYYVFDLAIAITYMSIDNQVIEPLLAGGHVLAGYCSKFSLNECEFDALKVCIAGRYAQSLVLGQYTLSVDPCNDYVVTTAKNGWPQLKKLWATPKEELYQKWNAIMDTYKTGY